MLGSREDRMLAVVVELMAGNLNTVLNISDTLGECVEKVPEGTTYTKAEVVDLVQSMLGMIQCDLESAKLVALDQGVFHQIAEKLEVEFEDILNEEVQ
mgnify:CR=1 FL=1